MEPRDRKPTSSRLAMVFSDKINGSDFSKYVMAERGERKVRKNGGEVVGSYILIFCICACIDITNGATPLTGVLG